MAKPASGTALNTGHALYTSLLHAWALLEGSGATSADSKGSNTLTLSSGSWATDADGAIWHVASANNSPIALGSTVSLGAGKVAWSIAFAALQASSGNAGMVCGDNTVTTNFIWFVGGTKLQVRIANADFNFSGITTFTTKANYLLTYAPSENGGAGYLHCYKDGSEISGSPINFANQDKTLTIKTILNGYTSTTFAMVGDISYLYVWNNRVLSPTDASDLHADPYAMFAASSGSVVPVFMNQYRQRRA